MSVLDKVRHWIDGDTSELVLEEAARDAQVKPRSQAEEFIVKIAKEVEATMQREIVPLPQGTTIIPTEYTIFLSEQDDKEWQGVKRRGLEQGLYHILAERAKEIAGKRKLETQSFAVELRVDGTLEKGSVRVQHSWEETSDNKTNVLSRPQAAPAPKPEPKIEAMPAPNFITGNSIGSTHSILDVPPLPTDNPEVMTHVQRRQSPELYRLEIWREGVRQSVVPVSKNVVSIGRGSKSQPIDIALAGDPEISRRHLSLTFDNHGNFSLLNEGRNPATINSRELAVGQTVAVSPGVPIEVCSYLLRIQPK